MPVGLLLDPEKLLEPHNFHMLPFKLLVPLSSPDEVLEITGKPGRVSIRHHPGPPILRLIVRRVYEAAILYEEKTIQRPHLD
jgi:hypothetical protein